MTPPHLVDKPGDAVDIVGIVLLYEAVALEKVVVGPRSVADENLLPGRPSPLRAG